MTLYSVYTLCCSYTVQAMVIDYDIYLVDASSPSTEPVAVTTGGTETGVYNGIPDWVYEGERLY